MPYLEVGALSGCKLFHNLWDQNSSNLKLILPCLFWTFFRDHWRWIHLFHRMFSSLAGYHSAHYFSKRPLRNWKLNMLRRVDMLCLRRWLWLQDWVDWRLGVASSWWRVCWEKSIWIGHGTRRSKRSNNGDVWGLGYSYDCTSGRALNWTFSLNEALSLLSRQYSSEVWPWYTGA